MTTMNTKTMILAGIGYQKWRLKTQIFFHGLRAILNYALGQLKMLIIMINWI